MCALRTYLSEAGEARLLRAAFKLSPPGGCGFVQGFPPGERFGAAIYQLPRRSRGHVNELLVSSF